MSKRFENAGSAITKTHFRHPGFFAVHTSIEAEQTISSRSGQPTEKTSRFQRVAHPAFASVSAAVSAKLLSDMKEEVLSGDTVMSVDGKTALKTSGDVITLAVPLSKAQGGRYYLDAELRGLARGGEFEQRGTRMVARVDKANADELLRILSERFSVRAVSGQASRGAGSARFSRALKGADYGRSDSRRLTKADLELLAGRVRLFGDEVKTRILTEEEAREELAKLRERQESRVFSGSVYDADAEVPVVEIETPLSHEERNNTPKLREEIFKPLIGQEVEIQSDGRIVIFDNRSKDALKKRGIHRAVLPELKTLIERSRYFDYRENDGQDKHKGILGQFVYAVPVNLNGKIYRCELLIDRKVSSESGKGSFKQQSVFSIADTKITEVALSSGAQSAQGASEPHDSGTASVMSMRMGELMEGRKPKTPSVRFQRVVLNHGSPYSFEAEEGAPFGRFRDEKMGTGEGAQAFGWGHYLTSREGIAKAYAEKLAQARYPNAKNGGSLAVIAQITRNTVEFYRRKANLTKAEQALAAKAEKRLAELEADIGVFDEAAFAEAERPNVRAQLRLNGYWELRAREKDLSRHGFSLSVRRDIEQMSDTSGRIYIDEEGRTVYRAYMDVTDLRAQYQADKAAFGIGFSWVELDWKYHELSAEERAELEAEDAEISAAIEAAEKLKKEKYSVVGKRNLYTAEIETGEDDANLLDWVKPLTREQEDRLFAQAEKELDEDDMMDFKEAFVSDRLTAAQIHKSRWLKRVFGSPEGISKFLRRAGFVGHKFPAQSMGRGDYSGGTNYVLYEGSDAEITGRVSWLRDETGEVFGWFDTEAREVVVIEGARVDTLLHELGGHATWDWAKRHSAELYAKLREYAAEAPEQIRREVRANYPELSEESDAFADEVFAHAFGAEHAGTLETYLEREQDRSWWGKMKRLFERAWKAMLRFFGADKVEARELAELSADEAVKRIGEAFFEGRALSASGVGANVLREARERGAARIRYQKAREEAREEVRRARIGGVNGVMLEWKSTFTRAAEIERLLNDPGSTNADLEGLRLTEAREREAERRAAELDFQDALSFFLFPARRFAAA